jgi:hypothetical protein
MLTPNALHFSPFAPRLLGLASVFFNGNLFSLDRGRIKYQIR